MQPAIPNVPAALQLLLEQLKRDKANGTYNLEFTVKQGTPLADSVKQFEKRRVK